MTHDHRGLPGPTVWLLFGCVLLAVCACAREAKRATAPPGHNAQSAAGRKAMIEHQGIWKWVVPPVKMHGMFDDHDPIGLVAGQLIPADCAFNWTDPDTRKLYCFTTATSLEYFLRSPQSYLAKAERNWRALKGKVGTAR